jgi:TonB family protein
VAKSAGDASVDASALEAVRRWKFVPAEKAGAAVESLMHFRVNFLVD